MKRVALLRVDVDTALVLHARRFSATLSRGLISAIGLYQRFVSPLLGQRCRFWPTCSHYAAQCLRDHGLGRGLVLASARILRCQPFHPGGIDFPPPAPERSALDTQEINPTLVLARGCGARKAL